jgi:HD-GYP domain-containing protein (c-di-GMP phosphodiesterase class II)
LTNCKVQSSILSEENHANVSLVSTSYEHQPFNPIEDIQVAALSGIIAKKYGYDKTMVDMIVRASALHDIGKVEIPDEILNKPGKLTADEFEIVKTHTKRGEKMLTNAHGTFGEIVRSIARMHHENYDGSGYEGVKASELAAYVQIVTLADTFIALIYRRCYREPWTIEQATEAIKSEAGRKFNPQIVQIFLELLGGCENVKAICKHAQGSGNQQIICNCC